MTQLLIYGNAVPLNSKLHTNLFVKQSGDLSFARKINSVPLTAVELSAAARDLVIVFAGQGEAILPVALLGTHADENLLVSDDGKWQGEYIPAFFRRYPFVFASSDDGKTFTLCIDNDFDGCNTDGRGERLFDVDGERTGYLNAVLKFVQEYQVQFNRTQAFCARLQELGLLEPMQANITRPDGQKHSLSGFMAVNRTKLKKLDEATLGQMAKRDELELVYLHLQSMGNFGALVKRAGATTAEPAKAAGDASADTAGGDGAPGIH